MKRTVRFTLNSRKFGSQTTVEGVHVGDDNSCELIISVTDGNKILDLSSETTVATMCGTKPDGTTISRHCSIVDNNIVYTLEKQDTAVSGNVLYQVTVVSDDGISQSIIATAKFTVAVMKNIYIPIYRLLESEPSDWSTNYRVYYRLLNNKYTAISDSSCPAFLKDTFYYLVNPNYDSKDDYGAFQSALARVENLIGRASDLKIEFDNINNNINLFISDYLNAHPELTTTVQDGAITEQKLNTKLLNSLSDMTPQRYGAVGDGVTDDTAAFVSCINNANGRPVFVPPGTYVVNYANCGDGKAIYLLGIGNPTITRTIAPDNNDKAPLFKFNNVPSAYISGITFNPQRDNFLITATTTKAIDNSVIDETEYQEWVDTACLYFYRGGKNIVIENCTFTNCSREGIYCGKGEFADIIVRNNKFKETSACLWLRDGVYENITFEDNYCDGCRTMPVEFDNTDYNDVASVIKNAVVRNNKFYNVCKCAIQFRAIDGLTIENNEYSNRGQLYEHGRKSSDGLVKTFIWGLGKDSDVNTLMAQNVTIRNNKGVTGTVLQLQPNSGCTGSVAQFANIKVVNNDFAVSGSYIIARCTENLYLIGNEMQGGEKSNLLRATAVRNVTIDKNTIESGARIYYEETVKSEIEEEKIIDGKTVIEKVTYTMVGDGENVNMSNNSANLIAAPFLLTNYGSDKEDAKVAFDLENNKLNTWKLIDVNQYYKSYFYSKSRNNVDTSGITTAVLGSPTNNKYGFNANSAVDLHSLDTTDATAVDGYVILRSAVTFAFPGRKIQVIITGQAVKTDTSGTTANKILNEITVPAGGILTLTYTGSGWYAS